MDTNNITVEQIQEILDDIAFAARYKPEDNVKAIDNADIFLKALLSPGMVSFMYQYSQA